MMKLIFLSQNIVNNIILSLSLYFEETHTGVESTQIRGNTKIVEVPFQNIINCKCLKVKGDDSYLMTFSFIENDTTTRELFFETNKKYNNELLFLSNVKHK